MNIRRDEYDFSKDEHGKFYKSEAKFNVPIYLESDVLDYFTARAQVKGVEVNAMINDLLKKDIALIEED